MMNGKMDASAINTDMSKYRPYNFVWKIAMCYTKALTINVGYYKLFLELKFPHNSTS